MWVQYYGGELLGIGLHMSGFGADPVGPNFDVGTA